MNRHLLAGFITAGGIGGLSLFVYLTIITDGVFLASLLLLGFVAIVYFAVLSEINANHRQEVRTEEWETGKIGGRLKP